jgi:hypothetical protein
VWKVFKGSGSGFASTSTDFALPSLGADVQLDVLSAKPLASASGAYVTIDIDGDKWLDLVNTQGPAGSPIGSTSWKVFKGSASGFAATAIDFALPSIGAESGYGQFFALSDNDLQVNASDTDTLAYKVFDLDGDGALDLVILQHDFDPTVGVSAWKIFKGSATGFAATSTDFALPSYAGGITAGARTEADVLNFSTVDIDGDKLLDLVVTSYTDDPTVGNTVWKVFKGACAK